MKDNVPIHDKQNQPTNNVMFYFEVVENQEKNYTIGEAEFSVILCMVFAFSIDIVGAIHSKFTTWHFTLVAKGKISYFGLVICKYVEIKAGCVSFQCENR